MAAVTKAQLETRHAELKNNVAVLTNQANQLQQRHVGTLAQLNSEIGAMALCESLLAEWDTPGVPPADPPPADPPPVA
jgi:hypothetical protein